MDAEIILIFAILGTIKVSKQDHPDILSPLDTAQSSSAETTGNRLTYYVPDHKNHKLHAELFRNRLKLNRNYDQLESVGRVLKIICNNKPQHCQCDDKLCTMYFTRNDVNSKNTAIHLDNINELVKKITLKNSFPNNQDIVRFSHDDSQEILDDLVRKINNHKYNTNSKSIIFDTLSSKQRQTRKIPTTERAQELIVKHMLDNNLPGNILTILSDTNYNENLDVKKIPDNVIDNSLLSYINPNYFRRYHQSILGSSGKKTKIPDSKSQMKPTRKSKTKKPKRTKKPKITKKPIVQTDDENEGDTDDETEGKPDYKNKGTIEDENNKAQENREISKEIPIEPGEKTDEKKDDEHKNITDITEPDNNDHYKSGTDKFSDGNNNDNSKAEESSGDTDSVEGTDQEVRDNDQDNDNSKDVFVQKEKLSPQDIYDFYQTAKQDVIDSALVYVRNKNSKAPDIKFIKSDYVERLRQLKEKHQRRRMKNRKLKREITKILFKRETSVKIRQHLKNNDGVYLPLWMFNNVKNWKTNYENYKKKHSLSFKHPKNV